MIPALIVGALTAWYLGLRFGIIIAAITAVALLVASVIPGMSLTVYALALAWSVALYFFGPKISKASGKSGLGSVGGSIGQVRDWARRFVGRKRL